MCLLLMMRTGNLREWRWTGSCWDKPSLPATWLAAQWSPNVPWLSVSRRYVTTPEAMARVGWRFHSVVEEPK
jgi:hypothetical protein